ncbi:MAG TPA: hypothetical protein H9846_09180, partial [Candidatus Gemmiger excrementipullorum]|nr:hypothetical protein [Candidatus Gemmiger excrementipullorum]
MILLQYGKILQKAAGATPAERGAAAPFTSSSADYLKNFTIIRYTIICIPVQGVNLPRRGRCARGHDTRKRGGRTTLIEVEHLTKRYGGHVAVDD